MLMMINRFNIIQPLCILSLSASIIAGCGAKEERNADEFAHEGQPVKITMMANLQVPEVPSDKMEKLLEEKTNSQLDIHWVPDGTYNEKFQASFATETLPQVVYLKNQNSFILLRDAMKDGQFWEIGPFLKDYPNLMNLNQAVLENTKVAGRIYSLYQERQPSRSGIIYRKDWADKLGLPEPKSVDDIYSMLKKFKEADPAGSGKTIPLADRNDLMYGAFKTFSSWFGTPNGWGVQDGRLVPEFMTKGYMDTMTFFRKLYDEKLINKDFPITSKDDQQNLMYNGNAGMLVGTMGTVKTLQDRTSAKIQGASYEVTNNIKGTDGKVSTWSLSGYGTLVVFPKSSIQTEMELKRILEVMDKFYSPEIANLLKYGVEGEHYTLKDSKVLPSTDVKLIEKEVRPYLNIALAETTNITPSYYTLPALEKANHLYKEALKFMVADPTASLDSTTFNHLGARLQESIKDATYQYILGKIDQAGFLAAVQKWLSDGGQKIIDEYNEQYLLPHIIE
jgi:putative aldouronate transport system substrate-binding protein